MNSLRKILLKANPAFTGSSTYCSGSGPLLIPVLSSSPLSSYIRHPGQMDPGDVDLNSEPTFKKKTGSDPQKTSGSERSRSATLPKIA